MKAFIIGALFLVTIHAQDISDVTPTTPTDADSLTTESPTDIAIVTPESSTDIAIVTPETSTDDITTPGTSTDSIITTPLVNPLASTSDSALLDAPIPAGTNDVVLSSVDDVSSTIVISTSTSTPGGIRFGTLLPPVVRPISSLLRLPLNEATSTRGLLSKVSNIPLILPGKAKQGPIAPVAPIISPRPSTPIKGSIQDGLILVSPKSSPTLGAGKAKGSSAAGSIGTSKGTFAGLSVNEGVDSSGDGPESSPDNGRTNNGENIGNGVGADSSRGKGTWPGQGKRPPPIGPPGWNNEDSSYYDAESWSKGKGKNGQAKHHNSSTPEVVECPSWCLPDDDGDVRSRKLLETVPKHKKKRKVKKPKNTTPHRIAVSIDDNVVYHSEYKRQLNPPSSGGFQGFSWPKKNSPSSADPTSISPGPGAISTGKAKGSELYGHPYPYGANTPYPYDSPYDQNTDYADNGADDLPDWLQSLQGQKSAKKSTKKSKGKCPRTCTRRPSSTSSGFPSDTSTGASSTADNTQPSSFTTPATAASGGGGYTMGPASTSSGSGGSGGGGNGGSGSGGGGGLPAGYATQGDTWTGTTLANICPKQCNPFNPAENFCDSQSSGCTTAGGSKYYCACRAGYRLDGVNPKDYSRQFKVSGQPYVYVYPGGACNTLCGDPSCNEVMIRGHCV